MTNRLHQVQQEFHSYEKEHRYANEEYFEHEQRLKAVDSELSSTINSYEKLRDEHALLNEDLTKCRYDLAQMESSDTSHKERVSRAMRGIIPSMNVHLANSIDGRSEDLQAQANSTWQLFQDSGSKGTHLSQRTPRRLRSLFLVQRPRKQASSG